VKILDNETLNLTDLICDSINSIFINFFSSIDNTIFSSLDSIIFITPDFINNYKFQNFFGTDSKNGLLLIANSLILGIILFYVIRFATSHLIYSKIDSPYQFIFKAIIFVACMNSSLWICEKIIYLISLFSNSILEIGFSINGFEQNFSNFINNINSVLFSQFETFNIFTFDGFLKLLSTVSLLYILFIYSVRLIMCKILTLLSPFAFLSLTNSCLSGFFKSWFSNYLIILAMQIFVSIVLVLTFSLDFHTETTLTKIAYIGILFIISKCHYNTKELFKEMYNYSHFSLKDFI